MTLNYKIQYLDVIYAINYSKIITKNYFDYITYQTSYKYHYNFKKKIKLYEYKTSSYKYVANMHNKVEKEVYFKTAVYLGEMNEFIL